jgi:hypothetical protein
MENAQEPPPPAAAALLDDIAARFTGDSVSVEEIVTALGDRGPAALLLLLTLPALVPLPGVPAGMIFGSVTVLLSLQMALGREALWLPGWLGRRRIGRGVFIACLQAARRPLARLESRMRPRRPELAGAHMLRPLSPLVFTMGLLIALPIPFGNIVPALALIAVALGVLTRDGVAVGAGMALAGLAVLVCIGLTVAGAALLNGAVT